MKEQTVKAIVTRSNSYNENDRIINLLTTEGELITAAVYGGKSVKSGKSVYSQLFVFGEFVLSQRFVNKLSVKSCTVLDTFHPLVSDYERYCVGCLMLSSVNTAMFNAEANTAVYLLLHSLLSYLTYSELDKDDLMIFFLFKLLSEIGFLPTITYCARCGYNLLGDRELFFSCEQGGAICGKCANITGKVKSVMPICLEALRRLTLIDIDKPSTFLLPCEVRKQLKELMLDYAELCLERPLRDKL